MTAAPPTPCNVRAAMSSEAVGANGAPGGCDRKHREAENEHAPAAKAVAKRCRGDDPGGRCDRVGIDCPLHRRVADVQVVMDPWQCRDNDHVVAHLALPTEQRVCSRVLAADVGRRLHSRRDRLLVLSHRSAGP